MKEETATLAGGCFWGMEDLFRKLPGVLQTKVGYSGGDLESPLYPQVKTGETGHAESLQIRFDASVLSFEDLLLFFFKVHDPTTLDRQGNDRGSQYRSAIFYHSDEQKQMAQKVSDRVTHSKKWPGPVVTQIVGFQKFYPAETYHQDYLEKNPGGYTCHSVRNFQF